MIQWIHFVMLSPAYLKISDGNSSLPGDLLFFMCFIAFSTSSKLMPVCSSFSTWSVSVLWFTHSVLVLIFSVTFSKDSKYSLHLCSICISSVNRLPFSSLTVDSVFYCLFFANCTEVSYFDWWTSSIRSLSSFSQHSRLVVRWLTLTAFRFST